jgi:hopanoid biosynthesis associated protein HpnK
MGRPDAVRRLIVNADDFGRSQSINQAVIHAHQNGILTTASLMVNEPAFEEAVRLAKENPALGVGLHLTLVCGHAASAPGRIPDLVNADGRLSDDPVRTGLRYALRWSLRSQLEREIEAQFVRFQATGLPMDHVNGHLHFHMHPVVFSILRQRAREWNITRLRLTRDRFWLNLKLASGRFSYRLGHAIIFNLLAPWVRSGLRRLGIRHTRAVFGLLQDSHVDEGFICRLLTQLPAGDSELYSHPSLDEFRNEFDALISARVKTLIRENGIELVRYCDLLD